MKNGRKKVNGSFTVEAAFVFPWVLFAICGFLYFYVYMTTQFQVYQALAYVSDELYSYGTTLTYVRNGALSGVNLPEGVAGGDADEKDAATGSIFDGTESLGLLGDSGGDSKALEELFSNAVAYAGDSLAEGYLNDLAADYFDDNDKKLSCVKNGTAGICFSSSNLLGGGEITVSATYTFSFPLDFFKISDKSICQKITINAFSGSEWEITDEFEKESGGGSEADVAYVTENGTVYHLDKDCIYITTRFYGTDLNGIEDLRNKSGGKYYPCERCDDTPAGTVVYISDYGTVYHTHNDCPAMIRNVREMPLSAAAESYAPCSKCGTADK